MTKRASIASCPSTSKRSSGGHREGWDTSFSDSYPWAVPVEDRDEPDKIVGVLCKLCRKHGTRQQNHAGTWTDKPMSCIRKDLLKHHGESVMHRNAEDHETTLAQSQCDGGIRMAFEKGIAAQRVAVQGAMKVVYWLCKEEVAHTTKYESLVDLAISLGCTYLEELNVSARANYRSRRIVGEFIELLSSILEKDILVKVKASPYYSLMTDESTDVAILKQLVIVARYVLPTGEVETNYMHIVDIPDGTATTIEDAILSYLANQDLDPRFLRGFGSDGANVMVGRVNGVATSLRTKFPKLISIHCANHRLALAAAHAADNIPYLKKFKVTLRSLFQFYQNSAVRMAGLATTWYSPAPCRLNLHRDKVSERTGCPSISILLYYIIGNYVCMVCIYDKINNMTKNSMIKLCHVWILLFRIAPHSSTARSKSYSFNSGPEIDMRSK